MVGGAILSNKDEQRQDEATRSTVTVREQEESEETSFEGLTPEEEKVIRMRHGLSEDGSHRLKFALGADEESRAKLALMEKNLIDTFDEPEDLDDGSVEPPNEIPAVGSAARPSATKPGKG